MPVILKSFNGQCAAWERQAISENGTAIPGQTSEQWKWWLEPGVPETEHPALGTAYTTKNAIVYEQAAAKAAAASHFFLGDDAETPNVAVGWAWDNICQSLGPFPPEITAVAKASSAARATMFYGIVDQQESNVAIGTIKFDLIAMSLSPPDVTIDMAITAVGKFGTENNLTATWDTYRWKVTGLIVDTSGEPQVINDFLDVIQEKEYQCRSVLDGEEELELHTYVNDQQPVMHSAWNGPHRLTTRATNTGVTGSTHDTADRTIGLVEVTLNQSTPGGP